MATLAEIHSRRIPRRQVQSQPSNNGNGKSSDPIKDALDLRTDMLASVIQDNTTQELEANMEARKTELELKKLELEAKSLEVRSRIEELRGNNQPQRSDGGDSPLLGIVAEMMNTMQQNNERMQDQLAAMQQNVMSEQIGSLRAEIGNLKGSIMERAASPITEGAAASTLSERIDEVLKVKDLLASLDNRTPEVTAAGNDINTLLLMHKLQDERERWAQQFKSDQEDKRFDRNIEYQKFESDKARSESFANTLSQLAPAILAGANKLLDVSGIAAPVAAAAATVPNNLPCTKDGCGGQVEFVPGQEMSTCGTCGQQYQIGNV